ncbi:hypothetical protein QR680_012548 [Steinernema hermaphroditum]|uniref:protein-tyrosine-phosphatase n=1 Tax=Steinernema hermaphroditum TaxID=289476 RepID=A0AA39M0P0_9BILA|nr:hypothetical protein QR680_012548 [Steinernema hermaphroditum]
MSRGSLSKRFQLASDVSNVSSFPTTSPFRLGEDSVFLEDTNSTCSEVVLGLGIPSFDAATPKVPRRSAPLAPLCDNTTRKRNRTTSLFGDDNRSNKKSRNDDFDRGEPVKRIMSTGMLALARDYSMSTHYHLPAVPCPQVPSGAFRSISGATLAELILTLNEEEFANKYYLVDCRYEYEYTRGHILNATNHFDPAKIEGVFFPLDIERAAKMRSLIPIFYCEFSQKRGPSMAHKLRELDRNRNAENYPYVEYPEIYVLDRGYNNFFKNPDNQKLCEPMDYVQMDDPRFRDHLRRMSFHRSKSSSVFTSKRLTFRSQASDYYTPHERVSYCQSISSELDVTLSGSPISRHQSRSSPIAKKPKAPFCSGQLSFDVTGPAF